MRHTVVVGIPLTLVGLVAAGFALAPPAPIARVASSWKVTAPTYRSSRSAALATIGAPPAVANEADPDSDSIRGRSPSIKTTDDEGAALAYNTFLHSLPSMTAAAFDQIVDDYLDRDFRDCVALGEGHVPYSEAQAMFEANRRELYRRVAEKLSPEEHDRFVRLIGIHLGWIASSTRIPPFTQGYHGWFKDPDGNLYRKAVIPDGGR